MKTEGWLCSLCKSTPPPPSPPPNTTTQLYTPTPLSSAAAPPPPCLTQLPADASCVCSPSAGAKLQAPADLWALPHLRFYYLTSLSPPPLTPAHSPNLTPPLRLSSDTLTHSHATGMLWHSAPSHQAAETDCKEMKLRSSDHLHKETRLNKMRQYKWCYLNIENVFINAKGEKQKWFSYLIFSNLPFFFQL